jgi:hypothetical protein
LRFKFNNAPVSSIRSIALSGKNLSEINLADNVTAAFMASSLKATL